MKTAMQELIQELEYVKELPMISGIIKRAEYLLELEEEHIRIAYNDGKNSVKNNKLKSSEEYYKLNWNQKK